MKKLAFFLLLAALLTGCTFPLWPSASGPNGVPTVSIDMTKTPCRWAMTYQPLYEISTDVQLAVRNAVPDAESSVRAYGAKCVDKEGKALTFTANQTNFYIVVPVADLNDDETLGQTADKILKVLDKFGPNRVPGTSDGEVEISFVQGGKSFIVRFPVSWGKEARKGANGAELLKRLENPPVVVMTPMQ